MSAMRIEVVVDAEGRTTVDVKGVRGRKCYDLTRELNLIGSTVSDIKKPEYYQEEQVKCKKVQGL